VVMPEVVEAVARDFDMGDNGATSKAAAAAAGAPPEKFDLLDALKTLSTLADRLRDPEQELPKEGKQ
ncbi:MAG TPA: hypothetical protein VH744_05910, partial [Terriglobales bacterium]